MGGGPLSFGPCRTRPEEDGRAAWRAHGLRGSAGGTGRAMPTPPRRRPGCSPICSRRPPTRPSDGTTGLMGLPLCRTQRPERTPSGRPFLCGITRGSRATSNGWWPARGMCCGPACRSISARRPARPPAPSTSRSRRTACPTTSAQRAGPCCTTSPAPAARSSSGAR